MDHFNTWLGNVISIGAIIGAIFGVVPFIAALVALVWYLIQIFESATAQRWMAGRRERKIARLRAKILMLETKQSLLPPCDPREPPMI
jgi:hypothetical protein